VAKSATFGVKWASDESFCPSTVDTSHGYKYSGSAPKCRRNEKKGHQTILILLLQSYSSHIRPVFIFFSISPLAHFILDNRQGTSDE